MRTLEAESFGTGMKDTDVKLMADPSSISAEELSALGKSLSLEGSKEVPSSMDNGGLWGIGRIRAMIGEDDSQSTRLLIMCIRELLLSQ